jgi:holin-like protein
MIAGLVQILACQGLGELVSHFALPFIPGPVVGLVLMIAFLSVRKSVPDSVDLVATTLVGNLGLLFVPAAVGVVMFWPQLIAHAVAIASALLASVVLTIATVALVLRFTARKP